MIYKKNANQVRDLSSELLNVMINAQNEGAEDSVIITAVLMSIYQIANSATGDARNSLLTVIRNSIDLIEKDLRNE